MRQFFRAIRNGGYKKTKILIVGRSKWADIVRVAG